MAEKVRGSGLILELAKDPNNLEDLSKNGKEITFNGFLRLKLFVFVVYSIHLIFFCRVSFECPFTGSERGLEEEYGIEYQHSVCVFLFFNIFSVSFLSAPVQSMYPF